MKKGNAKLNRILVAYVSAMLLGTVASLSGANAVPVGAATTTQPTLVGEGNGWGNSNPANKMTDLGDDVFEITLNNAVDGQYSFVNFDTWDRYSNAEYDRENSNAKYLLHPYPGKPNPDGWDPNMLLLQTGDVTFRIYNPDKDPSSPAGAYRYTVNYVTMPNPASGTKTQIVLGGDAVGGWNTNTDANRLEWLNGRYALKGRYFSTGGFKPFVWNQWAGNWSYSSLDLSNSTAADKISGSAGSDITVNTAGNYGMMYDGKTGKYYFHSETTTYKTVTKYNGDTLLEEEWAFSGINYHPTACKVAGKKFVGWYTDPSFQNLYQPGTVTENINLYGRYVDSLRLAFYDKNHVLGTGDVYAYGWVGDVHPLGDWPGTKMTKHGFGYYTLVVAAANICNDIVFNNNADTQTPDLKWNMPNNIYHYISYDAGGSWGTNSEEYHEATLFGIRIMDITADCDHTGVNNNVTPAEWTTISNEFNGLAANVKGLIKNHVGNNDGDILDRAVLRYDFIVRKYAYANFIDRTISASPLAPIQFGNDESLFLIGAMLAMTTLVILAMGKKKSKKQA